MPATVAPVRPAGLKFRPALVDTKKPPFTFGTFCRPPKRRVGWIGSMSSESLGPSLFAGGIQTFPCVDDPYRPGPSVSAYTYPLFGRTAEAMTCHGSVPATLNQFNALFGERK